MSRPFVEQLAQRIEAKRTFGRHPLWLRIARGELPHAGLRLWAMQFFLQVREFPRAVSALHSHCPDAGERVKLAESLYEEETGRLSGCGVSHPELFLRFTAALGLRRDEVVNAVPLPATAALIAWFEKSTRELSFAEGAAAIALAAEGQVPGHFAPFARALEKHYGLRRNDVAFWDVHEQADRDHSDIGSHIVVRLATGGEERARVDEALETSLQRWWDFFDGIEQTVGGQGTEAAV